MKKENEKVVGYIATSSQCNNMKSKKAIELLVLRLTTLVLIDLCYLENNLIDEYSCAMYNCLYQHTGQ